MHLFEPWSVDESSPERGNNAMNGRSADRLNVFSSASESALDFLKP